MRRIRKTALLAATALLAIAAIAPAANATGDPVQLKNMAGGGSGTLCPPVAYSGYVTGGCLIEFSGRVTYQSVLQGRPWNLLGSCSHNMTARIDGTGNGWITSAHGGPGCETLVACQLSWPIQFHKNADGTFHGHAHHCTMGGTWSGTLDLRVLNTSLGIETLDDRLLPGYTTPYGWSGNTVDGRWYVTNGTFRLS